ncbi:KilA, N-terminal/APSES-type HTH, DNA-binding family [Trichomonas vaginalis G3]|uniref:KilA, N-terminal/APSES-type HTH, DNA-binding family n=1 Tax=Trichomonas vaginalis (strain ATCC PRA-98 / G3) TaxID=412133 RepID=UPI0021E5D8A5|nr:KilA, N-terminal/APSES-type HTH, DNA-binding family [Trichomonas vaginalis G3]KAI5504959.1 KilA, N-terminal/APSES-type HTH, DNA-binding family [Trichomonas vaginalis G3]
MSTTENTTTAIVHEAISEEYEWVQFNKQLRLIRSVKDDMYQMQSILTACFAPDTKVPKDWFRNQSTIELLNEAQRDRLFSENREEQRVGEKPQSPKLYENREKLRVGEKPQSPKLYENRENLPNGLRGYYVHRLLVNNVAQWASARYSWYVCKLLDELHRQEREEMENKLEAKDKSIQKRIPRSVPKGKEKNYKYMIYTEEMENEEDKDMVMLHLVRRNNKSFYDLAKIYKSDRNWFYRENLPISMTPNEDVKQIVQDTLPQTHYDMKGCTILTFKEDLPLLKEKITEYFDNFKQAE